jgi:YIF1
MSFYNQSNPGGGFYNSGGYGDQYSQESHSYQQQQHQQSTYQSSSIQQPQQPGNFQQWAPSKSQNQQSQQPSQQQPQQQPIGQQHNFWNPANTMAVAGLAAQAMSGGMTMDQMMNFVPMPPVQDNVAHFNRIMLTLRAYFAVDNRYVQRKMRKVLFPFVSKQWRRLVSQAYCQGEGRCNNIYIYICLIHTFHLIVV